ncbi:MAG: hypothetical protein AB7L13_15040 [Acidimicrobiia bacterium]
MSLESSEPALTPSKEVPGSPDAAAGDPGIDVVRRVANALDMVASVARRSGGRWGTVATYLPNERIAGVRLRVDESDHGGDRAGREPRLDVHVVLRWPATVATMERDVRRVLEPLWSPERLDITVEDIDIAGFTSGKEAS